MAHIILSALLLSGMGLLTVIQSSQIVTITAHPGDNITIWCQHTSEIGKKLYWFKQTNGAVPLIIVYMLLTFKLQGLRANYLNDFQQDHLVLYVYSKNTSLRILNVDFSDSGLYYCGWQNWMMQFGDGTHLNIKERNASTLKNHTEMTNKDHKKSPMSTRVCSGSIFYKLTFIFGSIIVLLIIIPLTLVIIKIQSRKIQEQDADRHVQQIDDKEPHSAIYAALHFPKQNTRKAERHSKQTYVVYSATR
ncbi:uncharacterized protein LOC127418119 [Myxocyprinus asiaticus]|uniref:uncharacterized protein LOC127418119 n=1 Tax=Myxocyprinus asiaticus TaxID=70543 RepID=UPI002222F40C|nr:uncharacterized protein LOC127418119 [Myxocyprinus asiaticus]